MYKRQEKDRTYYEVYSLPRTDEIPEGYKEISFVCLRPDGAYESPSTVGIMSVSYTHLDVYKRQIQRLANF